MSETIIEERPTTPKAKSDEWTERIAAQQRSGLSVQRFCQEQGLTQYSFYAWRKRLQKKEPVLFALVERGGARPAMTTEAGCGVGVGDGRAVAYQRRSGRRYVAHGSGSVAGMIQLPGSVRVYLCLTPCDMRKSFDGLHALVREHLELDAFAGHLFVFASRRRGSQNGSGANSRDAAEVRELCCR
jgi:hypothetical protein